MAIKGTENTPKITTPIPGPKSKPVVKQDKKYIVTATKTAPVTVRRAKGVVVEDLDGNRLLDFAAGVGVLNTGHCHPKVVKAVQDQAAQVMHFAGTDYYYPQQANLAKRLSEKVPIKGASKVFFTNSGTESNEAAIKMARAGTGRHRFLAFMGAFHGRTQGSVSLTASKTVHREAFFGSMPGVNHAPFPNPYRNVWGINGYEEPQELANRAIDFMENMLNSVSPAQDTAAVFWEPVQGEGGYVVPPMMFPKMLRELCDEHDILLVADEVQTGFGRTGKWFASEHYGITADIVSIAKAMGSGMPIGAAVCRAQLDFKQPGMHSNTYGGNVVACASANATLDVLEDEKLIENSAAMGKVMGARLQELCDTRKRIGDHRGLGLMRALEFVKPNGDPDPKMAGKVEEAAWKRGLLLLPCGPNSIRFIPPLNVTEGQINGAMDVFEQALADCKVN